MATKKAEPAKKPAAKKKATTKKAATKKTAAKKATPKKPAAKKTPAKRGRKPYVWADEQRHAFESLCGLMATRDEICSVLNMEKRTLFKQIERDYPETPTFEEAWERFAANGKMSLRRKMFELALAGDRTMLIWLSKNHLGMRDDPDRAKQKKEEDRGSKLAAYRRGGLKAV